MDEEKERRVHTRFRIPVVIDAPTISTLPLIPEDVSAGGFCVIAAQKPGLGDTFTCSIQTGEEVFGSCVGEVVWLRGKPAAAPPAWSVGIMVKSLGDDRGRLAALLQDLSERLGVAMLPY